MMSNRLIRSAVLVLLTTAFSGLAIAAECARPAVIDDPSNVQWSNFILKSSISTYVIDNDHECFRLKRTEFHGDMKFSVLNRFPDIDFNTGYVLIKSIKTFSINTQEDKIKVSRGRGWYKYDGSAGAVFIDDQALPISVEAWNAAYDSPGDPAEFIRRLGIDWHAYAEENKSIPSTSPLLFWKIPATFERENGTITNYLIRFDINRDPDSQSYPPFVVHLQSKVDRVELSTRSNIGDLNRDYTFRFE